MVENRWEWGLSSNSGLERSWNEDTCLSVPELNLAVVADGAGGEFNGEIASQITANIIRAKIEQRESLSTAVAAADKALQMAILDNERSQRFGSTLVVSKCHAERVETLWVGDCRAYLFDGVLRQLTRDHTYVQTLVDGGAISVEEARMHPQRNVVTQTLGAIGRETALQPGRVQFSMNPGELLLMCSDGLTKEMGDSEISKVINIGGTSQAIADRLIIAANIAGGRDNISIVIGRRIR